MKNKDVDNAADAVIALLKNAGMEDAANRLAAKINQIRMNTILEAREKYKREKNWEKADLIRDVLAEHGIVLQDRKGMLPGWDLKKKEVV